MRSIMMAMQTKSSIRVKREIVGLPEKEGKPRLPMVPVPVLQEKDIFIVPPEILRDEYKAE
jgi:hypothetical protein